MRFGRRQMLGGSAGLGLLPDRTPNAAPTEATLLVPGPEGSEPSRWAQRLAVSLGRGQSPTAQCRLELLGVADGVTAANRFVAEAAPDGRQLLVLAGAACQARLIGDRRAQFDPGGWLPLGAGVGGAVVAGHQPLAQAGRGPLRIALGPAEGSGAVALLALDLLGLAAAPLMGLARAEAEAAFRQGSVEAILLRGGDLPGRLAALGAQPWFVLDSAPAGRDSALPEVPALPELLSAAPAALAIGARAVGTAARLLALLVLPPLTPADRLASWRAGVGRWQEEEARQQGQPRPVTGADAAAVLAALSPAPDAILSYRDWLLRRLNWRPE